MGAMFRSEEMTLCQMFIQPEAAYSSVSELGETGAVQFRDVSLFIIHMCLILASRYTLVFHHDSSTLKSTLFNANLSTK